MDYSKPGTKLPNGAIVIDTKDNKAVFAIWNNDITPWVIWRVLNPETGDCFSGTYHYTFKEASADWEKR